MTTKKTTTKKPTGLKIKRNGNKFECSWKIGDKDYGDGQDFQYKLDLVKKKHEKWHEKSVTKTSTSKSFSIDKTNYYPYTGKPKLNQVKFRVKGNRKKYKTKEKNKKGKLKEVTVTPSVSDWNDEAFPLAKPKQPVVAQSLSGEFTNISTFSWSVATSASDQYMFTDVVWQSILLRNNSETDPKKIAKYFKGTTLGWQTATSISASGSKVIPEDTSIIEDGNTYTRWFRVMSRGVHGHSAWSYTKHIYAVSNRPSITKVVAANTSQGGISVDVQWKTTINAKNPVDSTTVQYLITIPDEGMIVPVEANWTDASVSKDLKDRKSATSTSRAKFTIPRQLDKDQVLFVRVNTKHDRDTTEGNAVIAKYGDLKDPSDLVIADIDNVTHRATIRAKNNSDVEGSFLIVTYVPAVGSKTNVGIITEADNGEIIVQCPNWDSQASYGFEVYAMVGTYIATTSVDNINSFAITKTLMKSKHTISRGGSVPVAPENIGVVRTETSGTVLVTWDWTWEQANGVELSWSDHRDAWESTDEPDTYKVSRVHASRWYISGLETGVTWYIRVRFMVEGDDDNVTYGPYSDVDAGMINLSSAPNVPSLEISNPVITENGETIATWVYSATDGTPQTYAEIAQVEDGNYDNIIAHTETGQQITLAASGENGVGWQYGQTYNLALRVYSESGNRSEWSDLVSVTIAEPLTAQITEFSVEDKTVEVNPRSFSGDVITFTTDDEDDFTKCQVLINPKQDATPWIGTDHDITPYLHRAMPTQSNDYNRESGVLVGGTVAWNQMVSNVRNGSYGTIVVDGDVTTISAFTARYPYLNSNVFHTVVGHKYLTWADVKYAGTITENIWMYLNNRTTQWGHRAIVPSDPQNTWIRTSEIYVPTVDETTNSFVKFQYNGTDYANLTSISVKNTVCIDLTAMFGSTIADYIYSLEQANAGAGVAWFRKYFPEEYYPYSANTLQSVQATAHKTYDSGGNVLGNYALDDSLTLRGIPKLDASNNLYYDGDTYASDGGVTRKYGVVDLGTLSWTRITDGDYPRFASAISGINRRSTNIILICTKYTPISGKADYTFRTNNYDKCITNITDQGDGYSIAVQDSSYTDASTFKASLSGVYLVYELATPTTETAQAYTNPQIVDPDGTEEYVTSNNVPVGHDSTYSLVCPIIGYDEVEANVVGKNLFDPLQSEQGYIDDADGELKGTAFPSSRSTGWIPVVSGETYFITSPQPSGQWGAWYDENKNYISGFTNYSVAKVAPNNASYIRATVNSGGVNPDYATNVMVCKGSTATAYEPYQGQTYNADLPQTVYGGTVDLVSGELVIDNGIKIFDSSEPQINIYSVDTGPNNNRIVYTALQNAKVGSYLAFKSNAFAYDLNSFPSVGFGAINNGNLILGVPATVTTKAEAIKYLASMNVQIVYPLATPQTYQLTPQEIRTLVGANNVWSDSGELEIRVAESFRQVNALTNMPFTITVTGAGDGGLTTLAIERDGNYRLDRPDEDVFNGYDGETVLLSEPQTGEAQMEFDVNDLIGQLDDGASYVAVATVQDGLGQSSEARYPFEVHWDHQAIEPEGTAEIDEENMIAKITPTKPYGALDSDSCDIYRLSADKPELIYQGAVWGTTYVDPYPTIGEHGGHMLVMRTRNGDYITEDNHLAWLYLRENEDDILYSDYTVIDFGGRQLRLKYGINTKHDWQKDFTETKYMGGSVQGDWNPAVSRSSTLDAALITLADFEDIETMRRLAVYAGICHVRTEDGSSFAADIQVSEVNDSKKHGEIVQYNMKITRVDPEGFDAVTLAQWERMQEESE